MFLRLLAYVFLGWLLTAAVAGLGPVLHLSVMLPATSAILLTHLAFSRWGQLHWGLGMAVVMGYLEDLHQGAPIGLLATIYAFGWLGLYRAARRFTLVGPLSRVFAAVAVAAGLDLMTWTMLTILAEPLGFTRGALNAALGGVGWHLLGTALFVPAVWWTADRVIGLLDDVLLEDPVTIDGSRRSAQ